VTHNLDGMRIKCFHDGHLFFGRVEKGVCMECKQPVFAHDDLRLQKQGEVYDEVDNGN
jgi:hypothetical protein